MNTIVVYQIVVLSFATAAISVTVSKARIFAFVRKKIAARNIWLGELISCPYCTSHWVAAVFVAAYRPTLLDGWVPINLLVSIFAIVALATLVSGCMMWLLQMRSEEENKNDLEKEVNVLRSALQAARSKIVEQTETIKMLQSK